ncbi:MAG: hypothetical protein LBK99_10805 [Opitutaceae bacterium]|nr:hypothetical protein [Opitutaceae bacterium]
MIRRPPPATIPDMPAGFVHEDDRFAQVSMPIGGIGVGNVCLTGYGALEDFSIHHRPAKTALPDGWQPTEAAFSLLHIKGAGKNGQSETRLLEGPIPSGKIYASGLKSQGYLSGDTGWMRSPRPHSRQHSQKTNPLAARARGNPVNLPFPPSIYDTALSSRLPRHPRSRSWCCRASRHDSAHARERTRSRRHCARRTPR